MFDLHGRTALVTGSTQGIGFSIAKILSEHGAKVFVHGGSSLEKCKKASAKIHNADAVLADLSKKDCADTIYNQTGDVDILVLNASVQVRCACADITDEDFELQINTNFKSSVMLMQKYIPHMQQQSYGRIVTIGSVNQYKEHPQLAVYAASKSAQMNYVRNMARQLAGYQITVNNIAPGVILTPRNDEVLKDEAYREKVLNGIPCGYAGTAEDVAPAALLLCSEEGRYITGTDIIIDGGMHL